ncbi:hypothetical protein NIES4071_104060 (plasmid) [Calothrix sp. NIES-4071]|nr:hypothetical protein NIES4071_104060 [Calothrix sp. NIES-4071]BAZ64393.1 hypothetical protein NIES4105_101260 [Calothrix sp. NIES-4105]
MSTITYVKGLPTRSLEINHLGFTDFEMFLIAFSEIFKDTVCETVDVIKSSENFEKEKGKFNTHLQKKYSLSKRHSILSSLDVIFLTCLRSSGQGVAQIR